MNIFKGRNLVVATKHKKERVIAPLLETALGVSCYVPENFDSDELGTFTGEVERLDDPLATVRKKCLRAMELTNCDLAVASEGSFGSHPDIFFVPADDEFIKARELSTETNFDAELINTETNLLAFANAVMFPSHAIILRKAKDNFEGIVKGITDKDLLLQTFYKFKETCAEVYAETDMRAMYNPTRMKVIEKAALKLVEKINSACPQCNTPGFDVLEVRQGLLCSLCLSATLSTISYIYKCLKSKYSKEEMYPNKKTTEDPMYCDICNP